MMDISLAPISFYWPKEQVKTYYEQVAAWPVDRVYLGETVCSKRREMALDDWLHIADCLTQAGKTVVLSTLALVESRAEVGVIKRLLECGLPIEANDWTAVALAAEAGVGFYAGPAANIYNGHILREMRDMGLVGWTLPVELGRDTLRGILDEAGPEAQNLHTEVFAFGYAPLAYSARCFTARADNVPKDKCETRCIRHPQGLLLATQEGDDLFRINGIQTQSAQCVDLMPHWQDLRANGATTFRYSPIDENDGMRIKRLRAALDAGQPAPSEEGLLTTSGYWFHLPGIATSQETVSTA